MATSVNEDRQSSIIERFWGQLVLAVTTLVLLILAAMLVSVGWTVADNVHFNEWVRPQTGLAVVFALILAMVVAVYIDARHNPYPLDR